MWFILWIMGHFSWLIWFTWVWFIIWEKQTAELHPFFNALHKLVKLTYLISFLGIKLSVLCLVSCVSRLLCPYMVIFRVLKVFVCSCLFWSEVTYGQVWWPILGIRALHLTHPKCTHTAVNTHTHTPWTHTRSSGQPFMLRRPGNSWGFGALLKGTSVVVLRVERERCTFTPPTYTKYKNSNNTRHQCKFIFCWSSWLKSFLLMRWQAN